MIFPAGYAPFDGQIINGVAYFVRPTVPLVRGGGSALVAGDRWDKTTDGTDWFFNGVSWLSRQVFVDGIMSRAAISTPDVLRTTDNFISRYSPADGGVFILRHELMLGFSSAQNPTGANGEINSSVNHWQIRAVTRSGTNSGTSPNYSSAVIYSSQNVTNATNAIFTPSLEVNNLYTGAVIGTRFAIDHTARTGTPSNFGILAMQTYYRRAHL